MPTYTDWVTWHEGLVHRVHRVHGPSSANPYNHTIDHASSASGQWLMVRAAWRLPRFRWYRNRAPVIRQNPRDDARGLSSAPRLYPPSKSRRLFGGYPGGSGA